MSTNTQSTPAPQAEIPVAEVVEEMQRSGGSFVATLGLAALRADEINLRKIKATWPNEWARYEELARQRRAQQPATA